MNSQKQEKMESIYCEQTFAGVGMKITIPVLPSMGSCTNDDARSCVNNDDCFDLPAFANRKIAVRKESSIGNFQPSDAKTAALYKN